MPNYYTQFCTEIPSVAPEELEWLKKEFAESAAENDEDASPLGFNLLIEGEDVYIESADDFGSPESAAEFIGGFLEKWRPDDIIALEFSNTCSRIQVGAFGGGAAVIEAKEIHWMNSGAWSSDLIEKIKLSREIKAG